jgi:hypothetical protein
VIPFKPGRNDVGAGVSDPYFNLMPFNPYMTFAELHSRFSKWGLSDVDMLALVVGSHSLGYDSFS